MKQPQSPKEGKHGVLISNNQVNCLLPEIEFLKQMKT